jgi:hypothetical protein
VVTTGRARTASGGRVAAGPAPPVTLLETGRTSSAPRTGVSRRTSFASVMRAGRAPSRPKRSAGTPTTAFVTFT